jgi:hypothetical protein
MSRNIKAEQAGKEYFLDHPCTDHATTVKVARNKYNSGLEQDCFVAGWNMAFWKEQVAFQPTARRVVKPRT